MNNRRKKKGMRAEAYKQLDYILRNVERIKTSLKTMRHCTIGGCVHSDPTAAAAIANCTLPQIVIIKKDNIIYNPEAWLIAIQQLYNIFADAEQAAMRYFYAGHSAVKTSVKFNISERKFYYLREDFRNAGVEIACQYGLVKVAK